MNDVIAYALPFFALTMLIEWAILRRSRTRAGYEARDTATSLSLGAGYLVIASLYAFVTVAAHNWFYARRFFTLQMTIPMWIAAYVLQDLCFYWYHRAGHEVRLLWAGHVNHHSSTRYNLSTALRQSWTEHLFGPLFWWPLALAGVPVEALVVIATLNLLYQYWLHTELIGSLGPFGWVFNTPSFHRVHHGRNLRYMDKNYAGTLIVWDRLFGTFEPEAEPVEYGITKNIESFNPLRVAFHEWVELLRDLRAARSWTGRLGVALAPPGWREDGAHQTVAALRARLMG